MQVMVYIKIIIVKKISFYSFNSDPTLDTWMSDHQRPIRLDCPLIKSDYSNLGSNLFLCQIRFAHFRLGVVESLFWKV